MRLERDNVQRHTPSPIIEAFGSEIPFLATYTALKNFNVVANEQLSIRPWLLMYLS